MSIRAKAKAAAGSDARMNGCELPVIINSGSGNQGITCSVPLIEYAKELHSGKEKLYRALIISNLVAIHEKTGIGTLSAYCGAVSAGAGAGAGIVYLCGDGYQAAIHTVVNALAIVSGIVCDGAKASCAAKIASSVDAALLGYNMYKCHQEFKGGDGIVMKDIETTIKGIGRLGKDGDEIGIRNDDLVKFSCQKSLAYLLGDGEAVTHGQFGRFGVVLRKGRDLLAPEIVQSLLADGQDYGVLASDLRLNQLENVAVVAAGKTAVTGNDDIQCFLHRTLL